MKNISYQNDELLKKLFKRMGPELPSVGFSERVMNLITQPEVDMSVHQQTINKLMWTVIASVALIIPVLFFLLDWSLFDLFPRMINADNFNHLIVFMSNLPEYISSLFDGVKQYSLVLIVTAAGIALLVFDSLLSKSITRILFPFKFAGHDVK